jgi:hypothetical protein
MYTDGQGADVTRRALLLFAAASVIWGSHRTVGDPEHAAVPRTGQAAIDQFAVR